LKVEDTLLIKTVPEKAELKYFYLYDIDNLPIKLQPVVASLQPRDDNRLALYLGYDEAKMMKQEGLFKKE
jgi:hypothetical protein